MLDGSLLPLYYTEKCPLHAWNEYMMAAFGSFENKLYRFQETTYPDGHVTEVNRMTFLM